MNLITINSIIGNINKDKGLRQKYEEASRRKIYETIKISRSESQKTRMRKSSDKGTDIALTLPHGLQLRHGDVVMLTEDKMIVIEIEPENVAMIEIKDNIHEDADDGHHNNHHHIVEIATRVGHMIGNLHRPIRLERNTVYFPIQADSELDMFRKLLAQINEHLEVKSTRMVFEPEEGTQMHEH
jgi:urease accessory protein